MYSIIFTDIDGTLLHDDLSIGEDTISALRRATEKGIITALCSGRYLRSLEVIESRIGLKMMKIGFNGAMIEHEGRLIQDIRIDRDAYRKTVEFLKGKASVIITFTKDRYALMGDVQWYERQHRILNDYGICMDLSDPEDVRKATGEYPCKLLVKDDDTERIAELGKELSVLLEGQAEVFSSAPNNLEVMPLGISKGRALEAVSDLLSIPLSDMIAFGDWDNDAEMLRTAGMGVCMKNGSETAKKAARMITSSNNEDGIAAALLTLGI